MRQICLGVILLIVITGCKKEQEHGSRVDIYLLKTFNLSIDTTKKPAVNVITNAILADIPLVADEDIKFYARENYTFTLRKDIQSIIQNYGPDKAFAVTVDNHPIYYGVFHPMYLSSLPYGVAMIIPLLYKNNELRIDFVNLTGTYVSQFDKRNDNRIIDALKATGRLR
jgi:hypothetical protein